MVELDKEVVNAESILNVSSRLDNPKVNLYFLRWK